MKKLFWAIAFACLAAAGFSARAQEVTNSNHTVVRFEVFTGGTNVGSLDLELFDQEKPETVKSFLLYVYSGGYSNLVLHRLEKDFVIQAGHVTLTNADSENNFDSFTPRPVFGPTTNEYSVGPELSNVFGTIAMARIGGQTNSASTDWFINLADNSYLDRIDGGFTVFGRVVHTVSERTGTNLLGYFNQASNRLAISGNPLEVFGQIPVSGFHYSYVTNTTVATNTLPVQNRDLFVAQAFIIQGGQPREGTAPSVTILSPAQGVHITNSIVTFSGTAHDDTGVARVIYDTADGLFVASGTSNWSANVTLSAGTNHITVRAVDRFGNVSPAVVRIVIGSKLRPFTLEMLGKGKVTGVTNGQLLEVGIDYLVTAKPARGYYFNGWRGDGYSNDRGVYFTMQENLKLVVRFSKTFLGLATGTYEGVFSPDTNGPPNSAGFISLKLGAGGVYSGRLKPLGATYSIRGKFDDNGRSIISGQLGTNRLLLEVDLATEGSEALVGGYSDGHFFSPFALWRVQSFGVTNPAPPAGQFTFTLSPPLAANNGVTDGSGFGTVTVDDQGRIQVAGTLGDGTVIKQKDVLLKGNRWPIYFSVKTGDSVLGLARFTSNNTFSADVKWFGPNFPGATNQNVKLHGSLFTPPSQARLFNWTNGIVTLSGDGLSAPLTSDVTLSEDGSFTVLSNPNNIQLRVADATGLITGSFTHPASNVTALIKGAVLQSSNSAAGFFPGAPRHGGFTIQRAP